MPIFGNLYLRSRYILNESLSPRIPGRPQPENPVDARRKHMLLPHRMPPKWFFLDLDQHQGAELCGNVIAAWKFATFTLPYIRKLEKRIHAFDKYGDLETLYLRTLRSLKEAKDWCADLQRAIATERLAVDLLVSRCRGQVFGLHLLTAQLRKYRRRCRVVTQEYIKYKAHAEGAKRALAKKFANRFEELESWRDEALKRMAFQATFLEVFYVFQKKYELAKARGGKQAEILLELGEKVGALEDALEKMTKERDELLRVRDGLLADVAQLEHEELPMRCEEVLVWRDKLYHARAALEYTAVQNWHKLARIHQQDREISHLKQEMKLFLKIKDDLAQERITSELLRREIAARDERLGEMDALQAAKESAEAELKKVKRKNEELLKQLDAKVTKPTIPARFLCMRCSNEVQQSKQTAASQIGGKMSGITTGSVAVGTRSSLVKGSPALSIVPGAEIARQLLRGTSSFPGETKPAGR